MVTDLCSESFIATIKQYIAHRDKCSKMHSNNAKRFVGMDKKLKRIHAPVENPDEHLAGYLSAEGMD